MIFKTLHRKLMIVKHESGSELRYFGRVKLPAQLVATVDLFLLQIRWGKNLILITTNETYAWSFVAEIVLIT